jgi:hypothetical protein
MPLHLVQPSNPSATVIHNYVYVGQKERIILRWRERIRIKKDEGVRK